MPKYATGKYAKAISDRSGMEFPYKEMVREWNGSFVHISEFEPKQPQLEPKPMAADGVSIRNVRSDRTELPTAIALPNNPFAVTNGSATLTVSLLNHNLQVGDFVLFFDGASNEPTQSFGLGFFTSSYKTICGSCFSGLKIFFIQFKILLIMVLL